MAGRYGQSYVQAQSHSAYQQCIAKERRHHPPVNLRQRDVRPAAHLWERPSSPLKPAAFAPAGRPMTPTPLLTPHGEYVRATAFLGQPRQQPFLNAYQHLGSSQSSRSSQSFAHRTLGIAQPSRPTTTSMMTSLDLLRPGTPVGALRRVGSDTFCSLPPTLTPSPSRNQLQAAHADATPPFGMPKIESEPPRAFHRYLGEGGHFEAAAIFSPSFSPGWVRR